MTRLAFPSTKPVRLRPDEALARGVALSRKYGMPLSPDDVARVLDRAKVPYVLLGAHAINVYTGRPRATQDVDMLTGAPAKARRAIGQAFPHLTVEDHPVVIRFLENGEEVLDLIKAGSGPIFRRILRLTTRVRIGDVSVAIPTLEAALASKFCSMISPTRASDDRMQDAVDFSRAAKLHGKPDRDLLHELGELVYAGGGDAILKLVDDARAGRRLDV
jgi:nucleotidyltransferase AbiEii toxin of type IV toxin-antitoxin system